MTMDVSGMTCINCPIGCSLTVSVENGDVFAVEGNLCIRGLDYATMEVRNPTRMVTSTVRLRNGMINQAPVKTSGPVPKTLVLACVKALAGVKLEAPVALGQVAFVNVCGTGVDVIVTRSIGRNSGTQY